MQFGQNNTSFILILVHHTSYLVRFITMALETLNKELETLQGLEQELDQELTQAIELKQALELELELERDRELEAKANTPRTATTSLTMQKWEKHQHNSKIYAPYPPPQP